MESTAVTSLQPAPMTRRARREAEQQAEALRAQGSRGPATRSAAPHAPVNRAPIAHVPGPLVPANPAPVAPVTRTPVAPATRGTTSFDQVLTGAITRPARPTSSVPAGQRIVSRAAVIGTLAAATIAAPFVQGLDQSSESPFDVEAPHTGPNVLDLVTQPVERPKTSGSVVRAEAITRPESAASRSLERSPLPDCDVNAPVEGTNGALADHSLCELWQPGEYLRPDAALSLSALNEAFRASFGREMCLVASYRSLDTQYALQASRGWYAASPGTSMHGWGLAIDLCTKETGSSEIMSWLWANAPSYGWQNPSWAQLGGSKYEPWHWEFVSGVIEKGEWHG
ncbi:D-alanyl-D-alanine carboxypeptidase family protein [Promicromonospora sp. NPDC057138]|uniref:M15 family metallopeptidase n=1 Tax=Promicromonospora sp. NPDC057138 TaxID=3346031 RepID=UPI003627819C